MALVSCQAVEAVMVVSRGAGRFSAHLLAASILRFFESQKLFPRGITSQMDCVDDWAKKMGKGLQRLVTCFFIHQFLLGLHRVVQPLHMGLT